MNMATRSSARIKRLPNVSKNEENSADYTTSNRDVGEEPSRKKVRKELSVWEIKKDSEYFTKNGDHIYSKEKCEVDVSMSETYKYDRLPRMYIRKPAFMRAESEDPDTTNYYDEENISVLPGKRKRCVSKNAVNARLNRERKKQYISSLESIKDSLLKENQEMTQKVNSQEKVIEALQYEVKYLKSMLANSKEISEILKNLTKSTGLPVTSSLQSLAINGNEVISNDIDKFESTGGDELKTHSEERQPFIKRVTSGANFPILLKDVNLGSCDSHDGDELLNEGCEGMDPCLSPFSELSWDSAFLNECNVDLNFSMFDHSFDSIFSSESKDINKNNEPVVDVEFQDVNKNESDVGLCLHVNKKKISVELCSLCNTKAQIK